MKIKTRKWKEKKSDFLSWKCVWRTIEAEKSEKQVNNG